MTYVEAKALLEKYGQQHLLQYYCELAPAQKEALLRDVERIDFSILEQLDNPRNKELGVLTEADALSIEQVNARRKQFDEAGLQAIRAGKVAAVLLAGGQGSRLGSPLPKGMFDIGVTRELSIFGQQWSNIAEVTQRAGVSFHIFVMTSDKNDAVTREFFRQKNYFGYDSDKIHFYVQEVAPTCSQEGKIYLEEKHAVSTSPNGNGGWYSSLVAAGYDRLISDYGIEWLNVYSVDNVLQRICDPVFVGATLLGGCACSAKVVSKASPDEKVGVLCKEDGLPAIVEYYEMPKELAALRGPDGELVFRYGVTLNYLFNVGALNEIYKRRLPCHLAKKAIPHVENGVKIMPEEPCGYKFETLVVDIVKLMGSCLAVEVERDREFAPVKNREGVDSVESARALLIKNGVIL